MIVRRTTVAVVLALVAATGAAAGPLPFEQGRPFPLVPLVAAADGRVLTLADFRGRKVVLHVFASW